MADEKYARIRYLLGFLIFFGVPSLLFLALNEHVNSTFYGLLQESHKSCVDGAHTQSITIQLCSDMDEKAQIAFRSATFYLWPITACILSLIYGVWISLLALRKQVKELREELDA
jgi:hypothetical protein